MERLQNSINVHSSLITHIQSDVSRRREFSQLREQQDREYREAEEQDRRERQRREEEEAERQRREHEEQQRLELEEAMEFSRKLNRECDIQRRRELIGEEPPQSPDIAALRFQLPQGTKISRRFHKNEVIQKIVDFLLVYFFDQGQDISNIAIATHFPKVELNDMSQTVADAVSVHVCVCKFLT